MKVLVLTGHSKTQVFTELKSRLYEGTLALPDDPSLLAELRRLRVKYSGAAASVEAPRVGGSHGDRAAALARGYTNTAAPLKAGHDPGLVAIPAGG